MKREIQLKKGEVVKRIFIPPIYRNMSKKRTSMACSLDQWIILARKINEIIGKLEVSHPKDEKE